MAFGPGLARLNCLAIPPIPAVFKYIAWFYRSWSAAGRLAGFDIGRIWAAAEPFVDGNSNNLLQGSILNGCDFF